MNTAGLKSARLPRRSNSSANFGRFKPDRIEKTLGEERGTASRNKLLSNFLPQRAWSGIAATKDKSLTAEAFDNSKNPVACLKGPRSIFRGRREKPSLWSRRARRRRQEARKKILKTSKKGLTISGHILPPYFRDFRAFLVSWFWRAARITCVSWEFIVLLILLR